MGSTVKLVRIIEKHPAISIVLIMLGVSSCMILLGIGLTNVMIDNQHQLEKQFPYMTCKELSNIAVEYGHWFSGDNIMRKPTEFYQKWNVAMQRC